MSFKCPKCDHQYDNITSISKHWSRTHNEKTKTLYMQLNNLTAPPTCNCGCGEEVEFLSAGKGFCSYIRGHKARVIKHFNAYPIRISCLDEICIKHEYTEYFYIFFKILYGNS